MQQPPIITQQSDHHSSRGGHSVAAIVIHATAGTDSRAYLTRNVNGVSAHALISRDGAICRMVADTRAAHHCGYSRIVRAGSVIDRATSPTPNQITLGVELENLNNGKQAYPAAQLSALGWLLAQWIRIYPHARLVFHREIDTQGKIDPAGLTWPAIYAALAPWLTPLPLGGVAALHDGGA